MAVLGQALDRVAGGLSSVVLIEGEAGIGKTRLLDEAARRWAPKSGVRFISDTTVVRRWSDAKAAAVAPSQHQAG